MQSFLQMSNFKCNDIGMHVLEGFESRMIILSSASANSNNLSSKALPAVNWLDPFCKRTSDLQEIELDGTQLSTSGLGNKTQTTCCQMAKLKQNGGSTVLACGL